MNLSPEPSPPPKDSSHSPNTEESDFEQALLEVEQALSALKQRYLQIQSARQRQKELQYRRAEIRKQLQGKDNKQLWQELRQELQQIQAELETIELNLESSLFTWSSLKEPFWQAIRFGGLGIAIGWLLKSCTG
ncbi:MAG: DUF2203 domain-containing protein [Oscillatoriaceae bacterium SKW80]|nr:DUF2203 domain-containing protein [Oscillatoriaceae bacterium SKYG93]MCX8120921.1 DUF2203 domain-containing protein [Oscillatoriaceae bacterium SKW80]MDW8452194.1 DUF2203 domain-containing protein [Oscillatoriaceae cyanobacterium SKYGB_i_bin93]HIK26531.1 DUF2203 domain-containing protein [Oscillatoriaceae cyanobacterium M7585_C2015_266]